MHLQLIVPHWKERPDEMTPLLDSIALQQGIDFEKDVGVIIVYDGSEATPLPAEEWDEKYPYMIEHLCVPHGGVSAARNHGLKYATADYIMFCDADDMFCHMCGLRIVLNEITKGFDSMTSAFIEEGYRPGETIPTYVIHQKDSTFVHGKVHRRRYLLDNDILFNEDLKVHEDSYFNVLAQSCGPDPDRIKYCPEGFYLWKWRDNSICRHDPDYLLKTYPDMLKSSDALVDELERRGLEEKARVFAGMMILQTYYTFNKKEWTEKTHADYRRISEQHFKRYYLKHLDKWEAIPDQAKMHMSMEIRSRSVGTGMPMESITFGDWINNVLNMEGEAHV